jgi:peptidoglycan/xylan/chitin deacetylase (PgdA/CDA1 family)
MAVPTLGYHDVTARGAADASGFRGAGPALYKLDWDLMEAHLDALAGAGVAPAAHPASANGPGWRLTFDDGGACSLTVARVLHERGWVGYFFVPTSFIDMPGFADGDDLLAIERLGHVVGSHSHRHPVQMSRLSSRELADEWRESATILAEILGRDVTHASVPGGYTSRRVEQAAAVAGIRTLFTSNPTTRSREVDGCTVLGRYTVRGSTRPEEALALVTGRGWARRRQAAAWEARSVSKRLLGNAYPKIRRALLARRQ